jgi:S-adenosylmethionine:diacylglycerol 3-amino-3-carboxypropyl transferase
MLQLIERARTVWSGGAFRTWQHGLGFGETYEDAALELRSFPPRSRVFSIAGAGSTARTLAAAGHYVTAVDISPAQIAYAELRAAGAPPRVGAAELLLEFGRSLAVLAGWKRERLQEFLALGDCGEQLAYWDRWLDTPAWRSAVDTLLAPRLLRLFYRGPFAAALPREFGAAIRARLRRGWAAHANRENPYAALLLQGKPLAEPGPATIPIRFVCADAADFLENSGEGAFDAFALSNIGDGASPRYLRRLREAVKPAASEKAVVVMRSFAEQPSGAGKNWAALDRTLLWGTVIVKPAREDCAGGEACCIC